MASSPTSASNHLLSALPTASRHRLSVDMVELDLANGDELFRVSDPVRFAYFPVTCIVTSEYASGVGGEKASGWLIGREGMIGIASILGAPHSETHAIVQFGGVALRIPVKSVLAEFHRAGAFQKILLRYISALITQASQIGVCNLHHLIEQRLCGFLSSAFDRIDGNQIVVTHESIGKLLGARRESITEAAIRLQTDGVISYFRGQITLLDPDQLQQRCCSCALITRRAFTSAANQP